MKKTIAEQLFEQGLRKGIRLGKAEAKAKGKAEAKAELLLRELEFRFGGVPTSVRQRIHAGGEADFDRWAERILTAASLDELFA